MTEASKQADQTVGRDTLFAWCLFGVAAGLSALVQRGLFSSMPHVTDAIAHVFQAKILCLGRTSAPLPPCHESFFQYYLFMTSDGRWFSRYPPGTALLIAAAMRLSLTSMLGPLLAGLGVVAMHRLFRRWLSIGEARWAGILVALSPMLVMLGGSYMSHTPSLTLFAAAFLGLVSGLEASDVWMRRLRLTGSGFCASFALLVRPQDALLLAPPFLLACSLAPVDWRRRSLMAVGWLIVGAIGPGLLFLWWNTVQYGRPLALGYYAWRGVTNLVPLLDSRYGFSETFTFMAALREEAYTWWRLNRAAFGWPVSFLFVPWAMAEWRWRSPTTVALLAVGWNALFFLGYDYYGMEYEARFYATSVPFLAWLTARGCRWWWRRGKAWLVVLVCVVSWLYTVGSYLPQRLGPAYRYDYEQAAPGLDRMSADLPAPALVLIPQDRSTMFRYSSGFVHNDPLLTNRVIYARDLGAQALACLRQAYPDRLFYRLIGAPPHWRLEALP